MKNLLKVQGEFQADGEGGRCPNLCIACSLLSVDVEVGEILFHPQSQACGSTWMLMHAPGSKRC